MPDSYRIDVLTEDNGWEEWTKVFSREVAIRTEAFVAESYRDTRVVDLYLVGGELRPMFEPSDA